MTVQGYTYSQETDGYPTRKEDEVADEEADDPSDCKAHADKLVPPVCPCQQIPRLWKETKQKEMCQL